VLLALLGVLVLTTTGCRLDVHTWVLMNDDGSGTITVSATADAELVAAAPGLADDLRLDDFRAAGWTVIGPDPSDDGGLSLSLKHPFTSPDEATALLATLSGPNGPFHGLTLTREVDGSKVTSQVSGTMQLVGGIDALSDETIAAYGLGTPFASAVTGPEGSTLADHLAIDLTVGMPGGIDAATTNATRSGAMGIISVFGPITDSQDYAAWEVPLDGTAAAVTGTWVVDPSRPGMRVLAGVLLIVLAAWIVLAAGYLIRRARRRHTAAA
jgi:hypothetical protein